MQSLPTADGKVPSAGFDQLYEVLGAATGLRSSDIAALRLKDIDWRKGTISLALELLETLQFRCLGPPSHHQHE